MNKPVAPVTAKKIVHPVAKNEHRYNFALNKTDADIALPDKRYVHLSSHWNPITHRNAERDVLFINRPGENDLRTEHPNE